MTCPEGWKQLCLIRQRGLQKDQAQYEITQKYGHETMKCARYHFGNGGWRVYVPKDWQAVERN